jgi:DNA-binding response OmpR family regulator
MKRCILNVEDDNDCVFFLQLAFRKAGIKQPLVTLNDGEKGINYLLGTGSFANRDRYPLPSLVLLDINLPLKTGFEVLKTIRATPSIKALPVVMLTGSPLAQDILMARQLGADHYLVKPFDIEKLAQLMKTVFDRFVLGACLDEFARPAAQS